MIPSRVLSDIYQTFGGLYLYPSVEEKASMLLYLVTKNQFFSDGNKRIAATSFLWFLNGNSILYNEDGTKRIAHNTLVALTLMIFGIINQASLDSYFLPTRDL